MMNTGPIDSLLQTVTARRQLASLGRWFYRYCQVLAGVYAVGLVASRLLAILPEYFTLWTLPAVPVGALLLALATHRRPSQLSAARLVDQHEKTKDLFLTAVDLQRRPNTVAGEYQDLVLRDAAGRAGSVRAEAVVPLAPSGRAVNIGIMLAGLALMLTMVPQFDPLGRREAANRLAERRGQLNEIKKVVEFREKALANRDLTKEQSPAVEKAIKDLKDTFNAMKTTDPKDKQEASLKDEQKVVGDLWKKAIEEQNREAKNRASSNDQHFGAADPQKAQAWKDELEKNGKTDALQKEMEEVKKLAEELAKTNDPIKQQELQRKIQDKLDDMANFAAKQPGGQQLANALNNAKNQMKMSNLDGMKQEGLAGMQQAMQLSDKEAQALAQQMRDAKSLDQALQAIQQARALAQGQPLDGSKMGKPGDSMAEYAKMLGQMGMQNGGQTPGGLGADMNKTGLGMGNKGIGRGGIAPEDPSLKTKFHDEQDKVAISAGKTLAQWSDKEVADKGHAKLDYQALIKDVKQSVNQAIVQEQVPPSYQDGIKKYFDTLKVEPPVETPATPSDKPASP